MYAGDSWTWRVFRVVTGWVIGQCALHTVQAAALTLGLEGGREEGGTGTGTESWSQSGSCWSPDRTGSTGLESTVLLLLTERGCRESEGRRRNCENMSTFEGKPNRGRFTQMLEDERGAFSQPVHRPYVSFENVISMFHKLRKKLFTL